MDKHTDGQILFSYFVSNHNPDFVVGSESWLSHPVLNSEVFPSNFTVFRKDRDGGHGGVFIACRSSIECKSIETDTECELVAFEVVQSSSSSLVIVSVYRPPYNDLVYMENLIDSINCIVDKYKNSTIWVAGDLNLPNVNWSDHTIKGSNYLLALCNAFLDLLTHHGFMQINLQSTRNNIIIYWIFTNRPFSNIQILPGISDHDAVCVECFLNVKFTSSIKKEIFI